jgi:uncharacterized repeat protein (TIGR01451 family)
VHIKIIKGGDNVQKDMLKRLTLITATLIIALALCGSVSATSDIGVSKSVNNSTPNVGDTVNFTITVTNDGPDTASQVYVQDYVSQASNGLQYVSHYTETGTYDPTTGLWNITDFANGATATLSLETIVRSSGNVTNIVAKIVPQPTAIGGEDPNPGNDMAAVTMTVPPAADIAVEKEFIDDNDYVINTANYGDTVYIIVKVRNNGPDNATGVVISDMVPSGLNRIYSGYISYDGGLSWDNGAVYDPITGLWNIGVLPSGAEYWLAIETNVTGSNMTIVNYANVSAVDQYDWNNNNNNTSASLYVPPVADLAVTKEVNNTNPNYLDTVNFTITVTNNGPEGALNTRLADLLLAGFSLVSATPSVGSYDNVTGVWTIGDLAVESSATLQLVAQIVASNTIITNYANVSSDSTDLDPENNQASVDVEVPPAVDVNIHKSAYGVTNYQDVFIYWIDVHNYGPDTATGVQFIETLPAGLEFVSYNTYGIGTYDPSTGLRYIGDLASGNSAIFDLIVRVIGSNTTITNNVTVTCNEYDWNMVNNNDSSTINVPPAADIAVDKTVDVAVPNYLDDVTFTVTVTNDGPDTAVNALLSDLLNSGFSLVSATPSVGSYDNVTGVWTVGDLASGASATLQLVAQVMVSNITITNYANASSETYDWNMFNNEASASVDVPPAADLVVTKAVDVAVPNYLDDVTFTVTVTNDGPDTAVNALLSDLLKSGFRLVSATPSVGSYDNVTGVWTVGDLASGASATLQLVAQVMVSNTTLTNYANASSQTYDWDMINNEANASVDVPPAADVVITKEFVDEHGNPIDAADYNGTVYVRITLTNNGPDSAYGVFVEDTFLNELLPNYVNSRYSYDNGATWITYQHDWYSYIDGQYFTWDFIDGWNGGYSARPIGASEVFIALIPAINYGHGNELILNTASVNNTLLEQYDQNLTNNVATDSFVANQAADIAVTKTVDNANPNFMGTVNFTVNVTNNGPDGATGVAVDDLLPSGFSFLSAVVSHGSYNSTTGLWSVGDLVDGASATLTLVAQVLGHNETLTNTANGSSDMYDWDMSNNAASASVDVPPAVDIGVDKRVSNDHPSVGDTVTWTIFATNYGPDDATGVSIFDLLPAGVTFVSAGATQGTYDENTGVWTIDNMSALSVVRLDITTTVNPANGSANVTNIASVDGVDQYDWFTQNDNDDAIIYLPVSDLSITKSADKKSINVGENVIWTINITNNGPANATNVQITDLFTDGLEIEDMTIDGINWGAVYYSHSLDAFIFEILAGQTRTITINTTALPVSAGTTQNNSANVTGVDQYDPTNATANASVYVKAVDVVVNKTVNNATPNYRSNVTFTVTATNNGPDNATGVVVNDLLPAGVSFVSATPSVGSYNSGTGVWTIGNLASGSSASLQIIAQVMVANTTITNTANLTAVNEYDTNAANNGSFVNIVVPASADIAVTKTTNSTSPLVCENFQWTVMVVNNGPNDATGVLVSDLLPAGLNLVSVTPSQGTYNATTGVWTVGTLLNGSSATLVFVTNATGGLSGVTVTNTATKMFADQYDWNASNNVGSASIMVPAKKTFTLGVRNTGTGRIHCVYYVTVYQPCNAAPIFKRYDFYLNAGQSTSFTVGTYAVGTAVSTDEFVYNVASSKRTVSVVNTWAATGLAPYVQNFVVANVPVNKAAHAMKRFWINRNTLDVLIVVPPRLL